MSNSKIDKVVKATTDYFGSSEETDKYDPEDQDFQETKDTDGYYDSWESVNYTLNSSVTSLQLESVVQSLEKEYFLIPEFQRQFVWKKNQIASLAFSIIKGFPIPPVYLFIDEDTKKQVILDGQQRTTAVFLYIYGLYFASESKRFRVDFKPVSKYMQKIHYLEEELLESDDKEKKRIQKDIEACYKELKEKHGLVKTSYLIKDNNGKEHDISFNNFSIEEQEFLKRKPFHCSVVECRDEIDPQRFYAMVFKVLNSGGKILSSQEIRNGVYWKTKLYKGLHIVNERNESWRKIYGNVSLYSKDVEILLKMLALNSTTKLVDGKIKTNYEGTFNWVNIMESYSSKAMKTGDVDTKEDLDKLETYLSMLVFDDAITKCNKAVFEAVFVCMNKAGLLVNNTGNTVSLAWLIELGKSEIFEAVLSNKSSVEQRLSDTYKEVLKRYELN